jgi:hypothetical protein
VSKLQPDVKDFRPPPDPDDPRTPFQRFEDLARRVIRVPKSEVDRLAAQDPRGPKGKRTAG